MKNKPVGAGEMTQWVEVLVTECDDISVIPGTHTEGETDSYKFSSYLHIYTYMQK